MTLPTPPSTRSAARRSCEEASRYPSPILRPLTVAALHPLLAPVGAFMALAVLPCALAVVGMSVLAWMRIRHLARRLRLANLGRKSDAAFWQAALRTEACLASNSWQLSESKESYVGGCGLFVLMLSHAEMAQRHRVMEALHAAQLDTKKKSQVRV